MNEYPFTAELSATGFSQEIELIAEFDCFPACKGSCDGYGQLNEPDVEEEIEITRIKAKNEKWLDDNSLMARAFAARMDAQKDKSQLEDEIFNSRD